MGTIRMRNAVGRVRRIASAVIAPSDGSGVEGLYDVDVGHWYLVRAGSDLAVVRFDGMDGGRPLFILGDGEPGGVVGRRDILVITDLGTEQP